MNPPVEEWIEHNGSKFERAMREADGELRMLNKEGEVVKFEQSPYFKLTCVAQAAKYLKQEIYWRRVQIIEKHCE